MSAAIRGVAVRCAAGDLEGLRRAVAQQVAHFAATPPYSADGLRNPRCGEVGGLDRGRPAEALLREVVGAALDDASLPPGLRVALVVGTSSGGVSGPWERWHRQQLAGDLADASGTGRDAPTLAIAQELALAPAATVCLACVSGTAILAVAEGWLHDGVADAVVVAGVDALSQFVHAGFSGLGALAAEVPRPFHPDRDGLVLGEGAAALVLVPATDLSDVRLLGSGMASDAVGMTAPDPDARGARRAIRAALRRAGRGPDDVDAVSVHGTGTRYNDAMEARALLHVFAGRAPAIHGIKHLIGHTLGAAGAIEAALVVDGLRTGGMPPAPDIPAGPVDDPAQRLSTFLVGRAEPPEVALSMSAAFGGLNAAVVIGRGTAPPWPVQGARCAGTVSVSGLDDWPDAPARWRRADAYVRAGLLALARLRDAVGPWPDDTALVGATRTGCRIVDLAYHARIVQEGAARASRRQFTYTLPGAPLCEASIHWGLHGAQLMFVGEPEVADDEASRWVRHGRAPAAVALWCEAPDEGAPVVARASLWRAEAVA